MHQPTQSNPSPTNLANYLREGVGWSVDLWYPTDQVIEDYKFETPVQSNLKHQYKKLDLLNIPKNSGSFFYIIPIPTPEIGT